MLCSDEQERKDIIKAMDFIQEVSCVRFAGRTRNTPDWVEFIKGVG
jgi:hypothetical protein